MGDMKEKIYIELLDNYNNSIEELFIDKPIKYQLLINSIENNMKNLPVYYNIFYLSFDNKEIYINNNEEYELFNYDILFIKPRKINNIKQSIYEINYNNLSDSKKDIFDEIFSCYICSEKIKDENPLFCYKCQKIFHNKCLKNWENQRINQNEHLNCPNCRNELPFEQWKQKLDYENMRNFISNTMDNISQFELNANINNIIKKIKDNIANKLKQEKIEQNKLLKQYNLKFLRISTLFKDILNQFKNINLMTKKEINNNLDELIKEISSKASSNNLINLSINNISNIIIQELKDIEKNINYKEKNKNINKSQTFYRIKEKENNFHNIKFNNTFIDTNDSLLINK